eukprot:Skav219284  [mRNA]  locus=scaffold2157:145220:146975:- [translate_table: standard]
MVGLPARGKSYISKAIVRYLSFGKIKLRDEMAMECLDQVLDFLEACGRATAVCERHGIRLIFLESLCDDEDWLGMGIA